MSASVSVATIRMLVLGMPSGMSSSVSAAIIGAWMVVLYGVCLSLGVVYLLSAQSVKIDLRTVKALYFCVV